MFWGVTLESGKRYSQVVESSYHLSMAALEPNSKEIGKLNKFVSVMIEHGKSEFLLCTLEYDRVMQVPLDLVFVEGEEVSFFLNGDGIVHLTGYVTDEREEVDDDDDDSYSEGSEEEFESSDEEDYSSKLMRLDENSDNSSKEEWIPEKLNKKKKKMKNKIPKSIKSNFKMESNLIENSKTGSKKSKFKNKEIVSYQCEDNSDDLKDLQDEKKDIEIEDYDKIEINDEMNKHFNLKSKKCFKKHKPSLPEDTLSIKTSTPIISKQISKNQMLNDDVNFTSIKKSKKISNKEKFKKNKSFSGEEKEDLQENSNFSTKKVFKKKKNKSQGVNISMKSEESSFPKKRKIT